MAVCTNGDIITANDYANRAQQTERYENMLRIIQHTTLGQYIQVSICTVLIYDTLLTTDKEVKHFWTGNQYNLLHIAYFTNRYFGIIDALSRLPYDSLSATTRLCAFSLWTRDIGDLLTVIIVDYILILRVLAFWNNNKKLAIIFKSFLVLEAIAKLIIFMVMIVKYDPRATILAKGITVCGGKQDQLALIAKLEMVDWLMPTIFEFILMIMALYKTGLSWRMSGIKGSRLIKVIITDQIIYYIMILFCSIVKIVFFHIQSSAVYTNLGALQVLGSPSFLCLLGSHMFFNLKEAASTEEDGHISTARQGTVFSSVSNLRFGIPTHCDPPTEFSTVTCVGESINKDSQQEILN
ncbi:hypothetical protein PNOK_0343700 [Pyrrhoderma noxium]|uniref:DUF6533 domain-containing protein n=1 Tax=Pyrrhoderma noxium TaxID=2282107 RepID=A0A286UMK8_9AGAM|nr:hypothetical protein PNOK_0343700 [Pyrrhoderma noxium]